MREETYVRALNSFSWFTVAFLLAYLCIWMAVYYSSGSGKRGEGAAQPVVVSRSPAPVATVMVEGTAGPSADEPQDPVAEPEREDSEDDQPRRSQRGGKPRAKKGGRKH